MKLVKHVLRPFNRTCNQLRKKHYVKRINTKMSFRFYITPVNLEDITQCLESMK